VIRTARPPSLFSHDARVLERSLEPGGERRELTVAGARRPQPPQVAQSLGALAPGRGGLGGVEQPLRRLR
jgi:hypothetical protein